MPHSCSTGTATHCNKPCSTNHHTYPPYPFTHTCTSRHILAQRWRVAPGSTGDVIVFAASLPNWLSRRDAAAQEVASIEQVALCCFKLLRVDGVIDGGHVHTLVRRLKYLCHKIVRKNLYMWKETYLCGKRSSRLSADSKMFATRTLQGICICKKMPIYAEIRPTRVFVVSNICYNMTRSFSFWYVMAHRLEWCILWWVMAHRL